MMNLQLKVLFISKNIYKKTLLNSTIYEIKNFYN